MIDFDGIVARSDAMRSRMRNLKPCARCGSQQVQFIGDHIFPGNDVCRCRECRLSALRTDWQAALGNTDIRSHR